MEEREGWEEEVEVKERQRASGGEGNLGKKGVKRCCVELVRHRIVIV